MKNFTVKDIETMICTGDYIADPMDDDRKREIIGFTPHNRHNAATVHFSDGGIMGLEEITEDMVYLESEVYG